MILSVILFALLIDLTLGDLRNYYHPVSWMGSFINTLINKYPKSTAMGQFLVGSFVVLSGGLLFTLPLWVISYHIVFLPFWIKMIILGLLLKPTFAFRGLIKAGLQVKAAVERNDLSEARKLVSWHLVSRETKKLSIGQINSAVIESIAENFTDSIISPLFFFALFGLSASWLYRFVNTADAMIGYHSPQFENLGKFAARLDDVFNWLPARLSAVLLIFAAVFCRMNVQAAWKLMLKQHGKTNSPNAGWTMAAAAGALSVRLEKENCYILNEKFPLPKEGDILRVNRLVSAATLIGIIFLGGTRFGFPFFF